MNLEIFNSTAVVTGGSSGIGAAIVYALAAEGCHVCFCARSIDKIKAVMQSTKDLPGKVDYKILNVTNAKEFKKWLDEIGSFDLFIPNVSALSGEWDDAIEVDIRATVNMTEAAIPFLQRSSHGALTYISSNAASIPEPLAPAYGAAKAAMNHYMKSMALKLLPSVRVNVVSPGNTLTNNGGWHRLKLSDPAAFQKILDKNPMGRLATPEEIAKIVVFISSPIASYVAGANWYVDGGVSPQVHF